MFTLFKSTSSFVYKACYRNIRPSRLFSSFFSDLSWKDVGITDASLLERLNQANLNVPTTIQAASCQQILNSPEDATIGAETGSGKTLAYLVPLLQSQTDQRTLILVPNKELVNQVVRMASVLTDEPPSVIPGGLDAPVDWAPWRQEEALPFMISTPASIQSWAWSPKHMDFFSQIQRVVLDEADMLLDGGYLRPLQDVLMGFRRADRMAAKWEEDSQRTQYVLVAATLPDSGLRSVEAYVQRNFPRAVRVTHQLHRARHSGLVQTDWIRAPDDKKERLQQFLEINQEEDLEKEKVMVFVSTVGDVDGVTEALKRSGLQAVSYHAKMKLHERTSNLDQFRKSEAGLVLVCTDLASRGLDVPGVTFVVQLQWAGNVVSHLHRMGRCGRAGGSGRGIIFYGEKEEALVNVVRQAEEEQSRMVLEKDVEDVPMRDEDDTSEKGTVQEAFSRKRGFTKKLKKQRREEAQL